MRNRQIQVMGSGIRGQLPESSPPPVNKVIPPGADPEDKENQSIGSGQRHKFKIKRKKPPKHPLKTPKSIEEIADSGTKMIKFQTQTLEEVKSEGSPKRLKVGVKAHVKEQLMAESRLADQRRKDANLASHVRIEHELNRTKRKDRLRFEEEFEAIVQMRKEKLIKLKRCIGVNALDEAHVERILARRKRLEEKERERGREECLNRTRKVTDEGLPVYYQGLVNKQPDWEEQTGDFFDQKNRLIRKFRESVTKIVIQIRAEKR